MRLKLLYQYHYGNIVFCGFILTDQTDQIKPLCWINITTSTNFIKNNKNRKFHISNINFTILNVL